MHPGVLARKVRYTVFIEKPISDYSSTQEICSSKDIDQGEHSNVFVDLGSCQMNKSDKVRVVLSFVENTGARGEFKFVADVVRFMLVTKN